MLIFTEKIILFTMINHNKPSTFKGFLVIPKKIEKMFAGRDTFSGARLFGIFLGVAIPSPSSGVAGVASQLCSRRVSLVSMSTTSKIGFGIWYDRLDLQIRYELDKIN